MHLGNLSKEQKDNIEIYAGQVVLELLIKTIFSTVFIALYLGLVVKEIHVPKNGLSTRPLHFIHSLELIKYIASNAKE